jgi:hypothetical protein
MDEDRMSEEDSSPGIRIGDRVLLTGGQLDGTKGRVYGMFADHLAILPDGLTDRVVRVPLIDGAPDEDLGLEELTILEEATRPGFISLSGMRVGDKIQTFGRDATPQAIFAVKSLDIEEDTAIFETETGEEIPIDFAFTGIPQELGFEVLRAREPPAGVTEAPKEEKEGSESDVVESTGIEGEGEGEEEEDGFEIIEEIVVPVEVRLKKKEAADRVILDVFQKSDLLSQLIQTLSPEDQKNPIKLQELRRRMEVLMFLQKKVVSYGNTGEPRGLLQTSATTLAEYIKRVPIPMSRKVVSATKVLYTAEDEPYDLDDDIRVENLKDIVNRAAALQKEMDIDGGVKLGLPTFYVNMDKYRSVVQAPIIHSGDRAVALDEEAFRSEMPNFDEAAVSARDVFDSSKKPPIVQVPYSLMRMVKPTIVEKDNSSRIVEAGDAPSSTNTLLFPRKVGRDMGPIRSGVLARDISYGMKDPTPTPKLLQSLGTPTEFPTSQNILSIGTEGSIQGTVLLETWLDLQDYILFGPGDIYDELLGYSLDKLEFTKEQQAVINFKIQQGIAAFRLYISKKREENRASLANLRFTRNDLIPVDRNGRLHTRVANEPSFQVMVKELDEKVGKDFAQIDTMWFTYLYGKYPDFLLATLGESPTVVAKFRHAHVRENILKAIHLAYLTTVVAQARGDAPTENLCPHVKVLFHVYKTDDPVEKMKKYISLLGEFRGETAGNWIDCRKCKQHLLCMHELLLIQEYLRPKEKDVLHKELLLNYSGGQFSGQYICKGCGKGISDLEFDTTLEFDDQGHPLMGRAVMEDADAQEGDDADELLGEAVEDAESGMSETDQKYYKVIKTVTDRLGINPEAADFRTMIEQLTQYLLTLSSREDYAELLRAKRVKQDYDIYYNIRYVAAVTAIVLLNIQCRMPDYIIYYSRAECKEGFMGFPLTGDDNMTGIQCVAMIVAGIQEKVEPWNMSSLQKTSDLSKRREVLQPIVVKLIEEFVETKPFYQSALKRKREYLKKTFGTVTGVKKDTFAASFRPEPYVVVAEAAAAPISADGASPHFKATAWIRQAHAIAKENTNLRDGSVLSQTTSCLHSILRPNEFWEGKSMPPLAAKVFEERSSRSKTLITKNIYKAKERVAGKVEEQNFYKLFLDVCYTGPRKGLPHELGLGLSCLRCGVTFDENPNLPSVFETKPDAQRVEEEKSRTKKKAALEQQGVDIGSDAFTDLLLTSHRLARMETPRAKQIYGVERTMVDIAGMSLTPFPEWSEMLLAANKALTELGDSHTEMQIVKAAEPFVTRILEIEDEIERRLSPAARAALLSMTKGTVLQTGEFVRTYLIVPFQRWTAGITRDTYSILDSYGLDKPAEDAILTKGMGGHLAPLMEDQPTGPLLEKVQELVRGLSYACGTIFPRVRSIFLRGGVTMSQYILRGCIMGFVRNYIDPNSGASVPIDRLLKSVDKALYRYTTSSRVPNEQEIRTRLEERVEQEKQLFIGSLSGMTAEKKKVELMNKQLGIGKWAVKDKDIRKYNSERFLVEERERMEGGFTETIELGAEEGYDHAQMGEDDF